MRERRPPEGVVIRRASADDELAAILGVLDGANLATDAGAIRAAIEREAVSVAATDGSEGEATTLVGALVLDGSEITHVAVRRRRRGQGIGSALVAAAAADCETVTAEFDPVVRPFYESLGFAIEPIEDGERLRGRRS